MRPVLDMVDWPPLSTAIAAKMAMILLQKVKAALAHNTETD
jgi:hypothetical protein